MSFRTLASNFLRAATIGARQLLSAATPAGAADQRAATILRAAMAFRSGSRSSSFMLNISLARGKGQVARLVLDQFHDATDDPVAGGGIDPAAARQAPQRRQQHVGAPLVGGVGDALDAQAQFLDEDLGGLGIGNAAQGVDDQLLLALDVGPFVPRLKLGEEILVAQAAHDARQELKPAAALGARASSRMPLRRTGFCPSPQWRAPPSAWRADRAW